jgi:hypothetical protein
MHMRSNSTIARGWCVAWSLAATLTISTCSTEQPKIACQTAQGAFAVKFIPQSGTGECATVPGGVVRVRTYAQAPTNPTDWASRQNLPISIRPDEITQLIDKYEPPGVDVEKLYAVGDLTSQFPGPDGFCPVGTMTPLALKLDAVAADPMDPMSMALPAVDLKYEWSNVRFYVSPSVIGTEFTADLTYARNGCTATYKVVGLNPSVSCEKTLTLPDDTLMGTGVPDEDLCFPCAQPEKGLARGSRIVPDIDVACDPQILRCMPKNTPPSLRSFQCPLQ